jgi:hypothetical protein
MTTESLEVRMARLEGSYEQIDKRLGTIEGRLDNLEAGLAGVRQDLSGLRAETYQGLENLGNKLRDEMRSQFYWLLGVIIVAFLVPVVLGLVF